MLCSSSYLCSFKQWALCCCTFALFEVVNGRAELLLIELLLVLISGVTAAIVIDAQLSLLIVVSQKGRKKTLLFELLGS